VDMGREFGMSIATVAPLYHLDCHPRAFGLSKASPGAEGLGSDGRSGGAATITLLRSFAALEKPASYQPQLRLKFLTTVISALPA
jgi:hypothetical protein